MVKRAGRTLAALSTTVTATTTTHRAVALVLYFSLELGWTRIKAGLTIGLGQSLTADLRPATSICLLRRDQGRWRLVCSRTPGGLLLRKGRDGWLIYLPAHGGREHAVDRPASDVPTPASRQVRIADAIKLVEMLMRWHGQRGGVGGIHLSGRD